MKFEKGSFVGFGGSSLIYRLQASGTHVRYRSPDGVSVTMDASMNLVGTSQSSVLSGTVTVVRAGFNPHTGQTRSIVGSVFSQPGQDCSRWCGTSVRVGCDGPNVAFQIAASTIQMPCPVTATRSSTQTNTNRPTRKLMPWPVYGRGDRRYFTMERQTRPRRGSVIPGDPRDGTFRANSHFAVGLFLLLYRRSP